MISVIISPLLHGEVGDVGVGRDLELKDALGGGGVPVEHGAVHRGEGVAGDDGGLDGELLDVRFGLLREEGTSEKQHGVVRLFGYIWHKSHCSCCA